MRIAYADLSRSAHSSHSTAGKALSHAFAALHHSPSSTPLCKWLGWMARARQMFPVLALLTREASTGGMLQLSLSASSLDSLHRADKKARLSDQAGAVSICSL